MCGICTTPNSNDHPLVNCTFTVQIKEVCRFNDKFVEKMDLNTEARINSISSPKGNPVANYNEGLHINKESLSIHANVPQEIIVGDLDIARPDNAGDVNFQWTYNPSGGRPLTEEWTESKNGTDDRYGCFGQDWNEGKTPVCSYDHPVTERVSKFALLQAQDELLAFCSHHLGHAVYKSSLSARTCR